MPAATVGVVESIDRSMRLAKVQMLGSSPASASGVPAKRPVVYAKYSGDPPPPLSYVDLDQIHPGVWRVKGGGGVGDRRVLLREDFGVVVRDGLGTVWADTTWAEVTTDGAAYSSTVMQAAGLVDVDSGTGSTYLTKHDGGLVLEPDVAYWMSCAIAQDSTTNVQYTVGFANDALTEQADASYASLLGGEVLTTAHSASVTNTTVPFAPDLFGLYTVDLVLVPDECAAMWVDGAGPNVAASNVPTVGSSLQPFLAALTLDGTNKNLYVDWVRVERFAPVASPLRDLVLPRGSLIG